MCGIGGIIFLKFNELGLEEDLLKAIKRSGFEEATPIQEATIPLVLAGIDVIGRSNRDGQTAAFGLPILQHVDVKEEHIRAIVVSPTRELAIQTQEELYRLGKDKRAKVQSCLWRSGYSTPNQAFKARSADFGRNAGETA